MGSITPSIEDYSVPEEAARVFHDGILQNPLIKAYLLSDYEADAKLIRFEGSASPSLPINWRFAESVSALKAYEALVVNALRKRKYGVEPAEVVVNTDHAQLFIMSTLIWTLDPEGKAITLGSLSDPESAKEYGKYFPNRDKHAATSSFHRLAATNIYKTKDGRFFHAHGSMNPDPTISSLKLPLDAPTPAPDLETATAPFQEACAQYTASELQSLADTHRQAGTIAWTVEEYNTSQHGRANAHVGLFEIHQHPSASQKASWWPDPAPSSSVQPSAERPLAGLKVVDLTRVIASPAVSRGLAELGASVMRVTCEDVTDMSSLHLDLSHGKWNCFLNLRKEEDRETLRGLVKEADVFLQGYRPHVLDKYGFGQEDVLKLVEGRDRGIVYARENCYGWQGEWMGRSGWQQISDACCGVSIEYGRAMGLADGEAVTPVFPNSDYCTGIAGTTAIMTALLHRAEQGGSYTVDLALNYYSRWLTFSVGTYPKEVWKQLHALHGNPVFRHYHNMNYTIPALIKCIKQNCPDKLFRPEFFDRYKVKNLGGVEVQVVKPVAKWVNGEVKPGYQVGTRGNGVDQPRWPEDLGVEVVV
ncbi:uncharacterized protein HMPREF1541_01632 [Cyphellophora europaea CBS 101466]|uniref:Uncharacterized protein n=1 Tax=Cyphellophora europaea (strain CBS 101466) TaxID=1220924 RepID=W2S193_CYPE1|nr:uncharacterized protein HMPREF1541_01632 [Cyphellophora europaea CBS 101466]ETN42476.1 hypothetical protein HMPREF1541_01632 [Cyphellophora europaea CBS 101466]